MRRADVDDAPPLALLHAGHRRARGVEGRGEVDGDDGVPLLDRELLDRRHVLDAGVVDQDVDRAEVALGLGDHVGDLVVAQHVGGIEGDARAQRLDLRDRLLVVLLGAEAVDDDIGAVLGERHGDAVADARGRAGDDGGLAFESSLQSSFCDLLRYGVATHPAAKPQRCLHAPRRSRTREMGSLVARTSTLRFSVALLALAKSWETCR